MTKTELVMNEVLAQIVRESDRLTTDYPNDYEVDPITNTSFGIPDLRRGSQMPLVAIDIENEELQQATLGTPGVGKREDDLRVMVYLFHANRNREQLLRETVRYVDLIRHCVEVDPTLAGKCLFATTRLADLTPPFRADEKQPFMRVASIELMAKVRRVSSQP